MFLGHATLAFGLGVVVALVGGLDRERALALGVTAGVFAAVPDVDMVYALVGLVQADVSGAFAAAESFWAASTLVHRAMTHSVVVAVPAAVAFVLAAGERREQTVGGVLLVSLVGVATVVSGVLGGFVMAVFAVAGVLAARWVDGFDLGRRATFGAVLFGLVSHPFGDVFTGEPPQLLYPLDATVFDARVALAGDPTLHLLGAFAVELAAIWLGVLAYHHVTGHRVREHVNGRAAAGAAYALAAFVIPPPTLAFSYPFVFSVVAVGFVGAVPSPVRRRLPDAATALVTGLAAVTVAGAGYAAAYAAGVA